MTFKPKPGLRARRAAATLALGCAIAGGSGLQATHADPLPPVQITPNVPADVAIPPGFAGNPINFFDDYSWRAFLALAWPASATTRGAPDPGRQIQDMTGPRVFETEKADWEVFQGRNAPVAWDQTPPPANSPCPAAKPGDMIISGFTKFGDLLQAGFGNLVGPLIAQNHTYVRFATSYNQSEFGAIVAGKLYLKENVSNVTLPNGSIDMKSAWIEMAGVSNPQRYYTREAWIIDPPSSPCRKALMGLVGLHIVQKTPSRPAWIWSTFEQVDNVPPAAPATFNDGGGQAMPGSNPYKPPLSSPPPAPYNVVRQTPINPETTRTNAAYQAALAGKGSVWQFYQLAMTQWPTSPTSNGTPGTTFPGIGATSAFANTTMETFDQQQIRTGCMNCHSLTRQNSDFAWSIFNHAAPKPGVAALALNSGPLAQLKALMSAAQVQPAKPVHSRKKATQR
jgi:hypothetical protein